MTLVLLFSQVTEHGKRMLKFKYRFQKYEIVYALQNFKLLDVPLDFFMEPLTYLVRRLVNSSHCLKHS